MMVLAAALSAQYVSERGGVFGLVFVFGGGGGGGAGGEDVAALGVRRMVTRWCGNVGFSPRIYIWAVNKSYISNNIITNYM